MKRVSVREHGRIEPIVEHRPVSPGAVGIPPLLYERLRRFDQGREARGASIFTWYSRYAKASQWVGVLQVEGLQVELLPKVSPDGGMEMEPAEEARNALLMMLSYAGQIPLRVRDLASLREKRADLGELLAAVFAERLVQELRRGVERAYVVQRDNLPRFRGKLLVAKHIAKNAAHRERFLCEHDELVTDTALNRVLRAACLLLEEQVRAGATLDLLQRSLIFLEDVSDVVVTPSSIDEIVLSREALRFEPLLQFCRMLFEGRSPTSQGGATRTFSLLFDMNAVLERFIAHFMAREVIPHLPGWTAHIQSRGRQRHLMQGDGRGLLCLKPDLLLQHGDHLVVVDTKWKRMTPGRERSSLPRADLYQLYAYTQRYRAHRSVLLFPHVEGLTPSRYDILQDLDQPTGTHVEVKFADLRGIHEQAGRTRLASELSTMISALTP